MTWAASAWAAAPFSSLPAPGGTVATGFTSTQFGLATTPIPLEVQATGFISTSFGTPASAFTYPANIDPYFDDVTLLLHLEDPFVYGAYPVAYQDHSLYANVFAEMYMTSTADTAVKRFGPASVGFPGTAGGYLFGFGGSDYDLPADFTIEFSALIGAGEAGGIVMTTQSNGGSALHFTVTLDSYGMGVGMYPTGVAGPTFDPRDGLWHEYMISRAAGVIYYFRDGAPLSSVAETRNMAQDHPILIGGGLLAYQAFQGHLDEIRITKGRARATSNYTVAAAAFPELAPDFAQTAVVTGFTGTQFGTPDLATHALGFSSTQFGAPALTPHAVGFSGTAFGLALAVYNQTQFATGFLTGAVGIAGTPLPVAGIAPTTVFGTPSLLPHAVGFSSTVFGIPSITLDVVGFSSTNFGQTAGMQRWRAAALYPQTRFGTPSTPTNRTQIASGFTTTRIGAPSAVEYAPEITLQVAGARGWMATRLGIPYAGAPTARTQVATGFTGTTFGAPVAKYHRSEAASGFSTSALGTPAIPLVASALGPVTSFGAATVGTVSVVAAAAPTTAFGTASARCIQPATGAHHDTRFGLPTCVRSNTYIARGINASGRVGHPRALNQFRYPASGFQTGAVGAPACVQRHRATQLPSAMSFGTPLLVRDPMCIQRGAASALAAATIFGLPTTA